MARTYHDRPASSTLQREFDFASFAPAVICSPTSREAARAIRPVAKGVQAMVQEFLRARGARGATDQEIQKELGLIGDDERPRRLKLVSHGLVIDSGRKRKTRSGRNAAIWVLQSSTPTGGGA